MRRLQTLLMLMVVSYTFSQEKALQIEINPLDRTFTEYEIKTNPNLRAIYYQKRFTSVISDDYNNTLIYKVETEINTPKQKKHVDPVDISKILITREKEFNQSWNEYIKSIKNQ